MPSKTVDISAPVSGGIPAPIRNDRNEKLGDGEPRQVERIIYEQDQ